MPSRYSDDQIVDMCQASKSDMPARCARAAGVRPKIENVVIVCKNAEFKTPENALTTIPLTQTLTRFNFE